MELLLMSFCKCILSTLMDSVEIQGSSLCSLGLPAEIAKEQKGACPHQKDHSSFAQAALYDSYLHLLWLRPLMAV